MPPPDMADRVHQIARGEGGGLGDDLVETDYSRFDGTISRALRVHVEFATIRAAFQDRYRADLDKLLGAELDPAAYSGGFRYEVCGTRLSGSPLTTVGNTLLNLFSVFAACTSQEWREVLDHRTIVYGDDGFVRINAERLDRTAGQLGLRLKSTIRDPTRHCSFVGRLFPNPFESNGSIQDPRRILPKAHIAINVNEGDTMALLARARAYGLRPIVKRMPILESYCDKLIELTDGLVDDDDAKARASGAIYLIDEAKRNGFYNVSWPECSPEAAFEAFCDDLDVLSWHVTEVEEAVKNMRHLNDINICLRIKSEPAGIPCIVITPEGASEEGPDQRRLSYIAAEYVSSEQVKLVRKGHAVEPREYRIRP